MRKRPKKHHVQATGRLLHSFARMNCCLRAIVLTMDSPMRSCSRDALPWLVQKQVSSRQNNEWIATSINNHYKTMLSDTTSCNCYSDQCRCNVSRRHKNISKQTGNMLKIFPRDIIACALNNVSFAFRGLVREEGTYLQDALRNLRQLKMESFFFEQRK